MTKTSRYQAYTPDADGHIHYSAADDAVWQDLIVPQRIRTERYCSRVFQAGLETLRMPEARIPQCNEISDALETATGWRVTPVPALISFDRFYALLADRRFPAASFIRSREELDYLQEPDIFHEIFGHTPLLANSVIAEFSHHIGKLGCSVSADYHVWLARLYWFTVEFGLIREEGKVRALGAGLASSASELPWAIEDDEPLRRPFDLIEVLRTPYRIDIHQPVYYVLDGLGQLRELMETDLPAAIDRARSLGMHAPLYAPKAS